MRVRGIAKTFYIPAKKKWILRAISTLQRKALAQFGTKLSDSDVIVDCISDGLSEYRKVTPVEVPSMPRRRGKKLEMKRSVRCQESKAWVFERVEQLLKIKTQMGMKTSFSQELINLAANGLQADNELGIILRRLLEQDDKLC